MTRVADPVEALFARQLQLSVARHSLCWLAAASLVGLWLALLLIEPEWGAAMGEFSYGRWMPLHLNWQLYGWCSLPMVGTLLQRFLPPSDTALRQAQWALRLWSFALFLGGWSWLRGETTGKLFLDWCGIARLVFLIALAALWGVLAWNYWRSTKARYWRLTLASAGDGLLLGMLAMVPPVLAWSSGRKVYPPIDPGTGGPTGISLLGSTLVIVFVLGILPKVLGLPDKGRGSERIYWLALALHACLVLVLKSAPPAHTAWQQITGLASLLIWIPGAGFYLRKFSWQPKAKVWLGTTFCWWSVLIVSGVLTFLPGVLDNLKFTNALVAHAHLAMGGLLTGINMLILLHLGRGETAVSIVIGGKVSPWLWQGALLIHLSALLGLASVEVQFPGSFFCQPRARMEPYSTGRRRGDDVDRFAVGLVDCPRGGCPMGEISMNPPRQRMIVILSVLAGGGDLTTGFLLVFAPGTALTWMQVPAINETVFLQFVGCFVAAVGISYLVGLASSAKVGFFRLRVVWELTAIFRLMAATFVGAEVVLRNLPWQWLSVTLVDLLWCAIQVAILCRGGFSETAE